MGWQGLGWRWDGMGWHLRGAGGRWLGLLRLLASQQFLFRSTHRRWKLRRLTLASIVSCSEVSCLAMALARKERSATWSATIVDGPMQSENPLSCNSPPTTNDALQHLQKRERRHQKKDLNGTQRDWKSQYFVFVFRHNVGPHSPALFGVLLSLE